MIQLPNRARPQIGVTFDVSRRAEACFRDQQNQRVPGQLNNVATRPEFAETRKRLRDALQQYLAKTKDPRALGLDAPWDYYPYYGRRRNKDWKVDTRD